MCYQHTESEIYGRKQYLLYRLCAHDIQLQKATSINCNVLMQERDRASALI